jgi:chromosome segregation ATPase
MQTEAALTLEQLEVEVRRLEGQLHNAQGQIKRAQTRLAELAEQYRELAPQAFTGDEKAKLELEGVEDERSALESEIKLAQSAQDGLQQALEDAIASLKETRRKRHVARAGEVYKELEALEVRRDEIAQDLIYALKAHREAFGRYVDAVRQYDGDAANNLVSSRAARYTSWIKDAFKHWL